MVGVAGDALAPLVQAYGIGVLREIPQIAIVSLADADGNYLMVRRGADGGVAIKTIRTLPGPRRVTVIERNAAGREIGRTDDPTDTFDPRTRGWYTGGVQVGDGVFWTDPYIFFNDRRPGITVSTRHRATNGRDYVLGLDLALDSLSHFLASLEIGRNGRAIIIDNDGLLIATANPDALVREVDGKPVNQHIDQIDDPALVRAYDAFRIEGPGRRIIKP